MSIFKEKDKVLYFPDHKMIDEIPIEGEEGEPGIVSSILGIYAFVRFKKKVDGQYIEEYGPPQACKYKNLFFEL